MKNSKRSAAEVLSSFAQPMPSKLSETPAVVANELVRILQRNLGKIVQVPVINLSVQENVRKILDINSPEFEALVADIQAHGVRQNIAAELYM